MQTISLSKTEQALVQTVINWAEEQRVVVNNLAIEKLASIIEDHDLVGKACAFTKVEDGSWVIDISQQELPDAAQEG